MRILADNDVYNGNIIDINNDDLSKSQLKPRDEVIEQVRVQVEPLVNNTLKRHSMEADCLYFEQVSLNLIVFKFNLINLFLLVC